MNCKLCLYFEACEHPYYRDYKGCMKFKNKADFVEVVRCKDCSHYAYKDISEPFCMLGNALCVADHNSYCSYGERK